LPFFGKFAVLAIGVTLAATQVGAQSIVQTDPQASRADWAPVAQAHGRDYSTSDTTKLVIIGGGTPVPDLRHGGISMAVIVNGQPYIVDAGPGFWRNSQAATPGQGGKVSELEPPNLTRMFLTHLHFDHTEGLASFLLAPWTYGRVESPQIYGPPGTENLVHHLLEAYKKDIHIEMFGQQLANATGWRAVAKDVYAGEIYQDDNVRVTAAQNIHGTWDFTYALRFETFKPDGSPDRVIVFSGDTAPWDGWEDFYAGADILVHEAYSFDPENNKYDAAAPVSLDYMQAFHTSTKELANLLKVVKPRLTILTHNTVFTPPNKSDPQRGVIEIAEFGYDGLVIQSEDGDIY
jgi:ribonuclease BN (tRNA processing enzyme)